MDERMATEIGAFSRSASQCRHQGQSPGTERRLLSGPGDVASEKPEIMFSIGNGPSVLLRQFLTGYVT
jgi:hypothetical protein